MVNNYKDNKHTNYMNSNPAKDHVYHYLKELSDAINWDSFNLTRHQQDSLQCKLNLFKEELDKAYSREKSEQPLDNGGGI
jgi:hypothetical protein